MTDIFKLADKVWQTQKAPEGYERDGVFHVLDNHNSSKWHSFRIENGVAQYNQFIAVAAPALNQDGQPILPEGRYFYDWEDLYVGHGYYEYTPYQIFENFLTVLQKVKLHRAFAHQEAKEVARYWKQPCVYGRGYEISLCDLDGDLIDRDYWDKQPTKKELRELFEKHGGENVLLSVGGGFDMAESPYAYHQGDYEPGVAFWDVTFAKGKECFV